MKRYTEYKDSGVEWIGEIPKDWTSVKLKFLVSEKLKYGANEPAESDDPDNPRYIRITDFGVNGLLRSDTFKSLPNEVAEPYLLSEGDILFARSGATVGKTFQFKDFDGRACYAGYLIKASFEQAKYDSDFIYYFTKSYSYENWKNSIVQQATIENIGADKYNNLFISIPPSVEEQTQIARYLDHKTAQIDKLISDKEKLIELLNKERTAMINQAVTKGLNPDVPMKDSGIEWLGEVPEHWEMKKLKYLCSIISEKVVECTSKVIVALENIESWTGKITGNVDLESLSSDLNLFRTGDVLFNKLRPYLAKVVLAREDGASVGELLVLRPTNDIIPEFLFRRMLSEAFINVIDGSTFGTKMPRASWGKFISQLSVPICAIEEQKDIVEYLSLHEKRIDNLVKQTNQEIHLLKEYKTALISEVVTGKVDIRDELLKPEALAGCKTA